MAAEKILLTGATGMLGKHILEILTGLPQFQTYAIGRSNANGYTDFITCDITRLNDFEKIIDNLKPSYIIHCAANVNVNLCEVDRDNTYALHVETSAIIASKDFIKKSIYISTDSVFDGKQGDYLTTDSKNPLNFYAQSKSLGEDAFIKSTQNSIIIRTNIIGYATPLKNSLFEWGLNALKKGETISGFSNIFFNPLYVKTLAGLLVHSVLLKEVNRGIYHFGSSNFYSKYDFLKLIASTFNYDQSLIRPIEAADAINGVGRPLNTTLNTAEASRKLNINFPTLEQEVSNIFNDINQIYV